MGFNMHDPHTLILEIRLPFFWIKYPPTLLSVWHKDPEIDGSDDSCGWLRPRLTNKQISILQHLAFCEAQSPWYQRDPVKRIGSPADAESLLRGAILTVSGALGVSLKWGLICQMACKMANSPVDNFQSSLCHLPGWHTNFKEDTVDQRIEHATSFFCAVARLVLQQARPWWGHPRYHFNHWIIYVYPIQNLKRWLFNRCQKCGKRFRYGEPVITTSWESDGPKWFKSEENVYHARCSAYGTSKDASKSSHTENSKGIENCDF